MHTNYFLTTKICTNIDKFQQFYGPRIGALFVRNINRNNATPFIPLFHGGGQERGFRPGTENTVMIAGLGQAAELVVQNLDKYSEHMARCQAALVSGLKVTQENACNSTSNKKDVHVTG